MTQVQKWAVVQFPGSNCDEDALRAAAQLPGVSASYHWHEEPIKKNAYQVILLPGGFSYGDYLRAGAIAKSSKALLGLEEVVEAGAHVMGICNGFQILIETRLLPGYLQVNQHLKFVSRTVECEIEKEAFPWIRPEDAKKKMRLPIAHRFGNYKLSKIDALDASAPLKYSGQNPNGSDESIAGIYRPLGKGSIFGLMPHPERAAFASLRNDDGNLLFKNAVEALAK